MLGAELASGRDMLTHAYLVPPRFAPCLQPPATPPAWLVIGSMLTDPALQARVKTPLWRLSLLQYDIKVVLACGLCYGELDMAGLAGRNAVESKSFWRRSPHWLPFD